MVKVPSDPAQIIVSHASFRVQLAASTRRNQSPRIARHVSAIDDTARVPVVGAAGRAGAAAGGRRRAVVWSGKSAPDDTGAHRLLQAVRAGSVGHGEPPAADAGATQVIPRVDLAHDLADLDPILLLVVLPKVWTEENAVYSCGERAFRRWRKNDGAVAEVPSDVLETAGVGRAETVITRSWSVRSAPKTLVVTPQAPQRIVWSLTSKRWREGEV